MRNTNNPPARSLARSLAFGLAAPLALATACAGLDAPDVDSDDVGSADFAGVVDNGQGLNGQSLNGQGLNGQGLNGQGLNGQGLNGPNAGTFTIWTSFVGVKVGGTVLDSTTLQGTAFYGKKGSSVYQGTQFDQAEFEAMKGDGTSVKVRIREPYAPPAGDDTWRYHVEYKETDGNWYSICEDDVGPRLAIPVAGAWDHRQGVEGGGSHIDDPSKFTFACEHAGAIGKCINLGYRPWRTLDGVKLDKHHQACVRLLRGDYCGDGTSYTVDGTLVNLYDGLGIQSDTESWVIEAEWDQNGARCFYPLNRSRAGIPCYDARVEVACGSTANFERGALLINETESDGITPQQ